MSAPQLIDQHGRPLQASLRRSPARASSAHHAGDRFRQELADWYPFLGSADADFLPERETIAARIHDLARNDGWASGALQKHLDNVVGAMFTLQAEPDWRALGQTKEWADDWSQQVESLWTSYAHDPDFHCDAKRERSMVGLFGLMYRHRILDGENLALLLWLAERQGAGRYATTLQVIDPDRLSNPYDDADREFLRGGIELGIYGEPLAYHIRKTHPGDILGYGVVGRRFEWERVPRETSFGRRIVIHDFEPDRAGQTRGKSPLTPIVKKLKMLGTYDEAELRAAVLNAIFAAFITSPFDHEMVTGAMQTEALPAYQDQRAAFHEDSRLRLGGVRIPILFPGEDFKMNTATRPAEAYAPFEEAALRNVATAAGLSYEQLAMDWSKTNYSSARAGLLEVWKFMTARRGYFAEQGARPVYAAWLEEAIDLGDVELPPGAPDFQEAKAAWTRCSWTGPGRGWVDPVKEAQGAVIRMEAGISTLKRECAEQGLDWREVLAQRKRELDEMARLGLPRMDWTQAQAAGSPAAPDETESTR